MKSSIPLLLAAAAIAAPAVAQAPNWSKAQQISITMTSDRFVPDRIVLRRNTPYVLHIANRSDKGHNLTQKAFFANARIPPADRGWTRDGEVVLKAGERTTIRLIAPGTPRGGTYQFSSTTLADAASEYKGVFIMR